MTALDHQEEFKTGECPTNDVDCKLKSSNISLSKMASLVIVHIVLEASRVHLHTASKAILVTTASALVNQLEIPRTLGANLKTMILPIADEIHDWERRYGNDVRPVLTSQGMVDSIKSARAYLDANQPVIRKFEVACDHCLEEDIVEFGQQLTAMDRLKYSNGYDKHDRNFRCEDYHIPNVLSSFWYCTHQGRFESRIRREDLSWRQRAVGFARARACGNTIAIKYFLHEASEETIEIIKDGNWFLKIWYRLPNYIFFRPTFSPALTGTLFGILRTDPRLITTTSISYELLRLFMKWPYQSQFLTVARLLMKNLRGFLYWKVLSLIATKNHAGYFDHDYESMFVDFWNMGAHNRTDIEECYWLPFYVFFLRNEALAVHVFDEISEEHKDRYLFNFNNECFCLHLIYRREYSVLELLMKVSRARNRNLFLKFERFWTHRSTVQFHEYECLAPAHITEEQQPMLNEDERKQRLLEFFEIISKYSIEQGL